MLDADAPVYVFWLRDDAGMLASTVAIVWRQGQSSPREFSFVHALLKPALEVLRRELLARASIDMLHGSLSALDRELELVLSASDAPPKTGQDGADEFRVLLQNATGLLAFLPAPAADRHAEDRWRFCPRHLA